MLDIVIVLEDLHLAELSVGHNLDAFSVKVIGAVEVYLADRLGECLHQFNYIVLGSDHSL